MQAISEIACKTLNHLVKQEKWAQEILVKHEGKIIDLELPIGRMQFVIQAGLFQRLNQVKGVSDASMSENTPPAVRFEISQDAIWAFLSGGKTAALKHVKIVGDVDFAADLNQLASDLRWELEEDLSKLFGDAVANNMTLRSKKILEQGKSAINDLQMGIRDYLVNEKNALVGSQELANFKSDLRVLRDDVERTEKRMQQLMQACKTP